jgi:hypothetical protein
MEVKKMPRPCACGCGLSVDEIGEYYKEGIDSAGNDVRHDSLTDEQRKKMKKEIKEAKANWFPQT